jgi:hypothetical protein
MPWWAFLLCIWLSAVSVIFDERNYVDDVCSLTKQITLFRQGIIFEKNLYCFIRSICLQCMFVSWQQSNNIRS